jgi:hypothetical protein
MTEWAGVVIAAFAVIVSLYAIIRVRRRDGNKDLQEGEKEKSEISVQMTMMLGEIRGISTTVDKIEKQTSRIEDRILDHERRLVRIETIYKMKEEQEP